MLKNRLHKLYFFFLIFINFFPVIGQKLSDEDLNDKQIDFLEALSEEEPKMNYNEKGIEGFYEYYKGKKRIEILGKTTGNKVVDDISLLTTLPDLESLRLINCLTTNFSVLKKAPKLIELEIDEHQSLLSLDSVFEITQLKKLSINETANIKTSELSGIEKLSSLKQLFLKDLSITDVSAITKLIRLEKIELHSLKIEQIGDWSSLTFLKELTLFDCNIDNTIFIKNNEAIESLTILKNKLSTVNLACENLKWLSLGRNQLISLGNLKSAKNLTGLDLSSNKLSDITDLKHLKKLELVDLSSNNISDVCVLTSNKKLETVKLSNNPIVGLSCLEQLSNLENLTANNTCFCNPTDIDELKEGVSCNIFEKFLLWALNHILYLMIGVVIGFFMILFLKKRANK